MKNVLSLIDNVGLSLSRYFDEKPNDMDDGKRPLSLPSDAKRRNVLDSCATLRGKFEMFCHSVGICMQNRLEVENIKIIPIEILINESKSHRISISTNLLDRANIACNFYNMVNISASFRDAITRLIVHAYGDEIKARIRGESEISLNKVKSIQLTKVLGENCLLGAVIDNYISQSDEYKKIISLRNYLVHHSVTGILSADYIHQKSMPKLDPAWTPTGTFMVLSDYAKFVYTTTADLITRICKCIIERPAECVKG